MKNAFKISFIWIMLVVYGFTTSFYGVGDFSHNLKKDNSSNVVFTNTTYPIHVHTSSNEIISIGVSHTPSHAVKTKYAGFTSLLKATEQLLLQTFQQYLFYTTSLLLRFVRTDIIFPFHYFW